MMKRQAFKFRLKPSPEQAQLMVRFAGCRRHVWNLGLTEQNRRRDSGEKFLSYYQLCELLVQWKRQEEHSFLKEAPAQCLQQTLKDLRKGIDDAFDPKQPNKKWPKIKKKYRCIDSFRYPQGVEIDNRRVSLPKLGWIGFFKSRDIEGKPKNVTVRLEQGQWFVSIQTELVLRDESGTEVEPKHKSKSVVGLDMGVVRFVTLSNGSYEEPLNSFRKLEAKLAKAQQKLAKKKKFSNNWKKQKERIARIHRKIANCRKDFLHKHSTIISKTHAIVVVEDLGIENMTKSARGTIENPGRNVAQKSGLNKSILDQGWGMFVDMLKYKLEWLGGQLIPVPPAWTSCTCPKCEHCSKENRKTQEHFCCIICGYSENADHVGAINVERAGHAQIACERTDLVSAWKQEPLLALTLQQESSSFREGRMSTCFTVGNHGNSLI